MLLGHDQIHGETCSTAAGVSREATSSYDQRVVLMCWLIMVQEGEETSQSNALKCAMLDFRVNLYKLELGSREIEKI